MRNDADLSRACRRGDHNAWRQLIRQYTPLCYRVALRMLRDPVEAEDASQEAFARIYRSFDSFDPTRPLSPWIARITYNVSLQRLQQAARVRTDTLDEAQVPASLHDDVEPSPEQTLANKEEAGILHRTFERLAPEDRALLNLRYREGMSDAEVAEASDMPVGTVKTRIFRARSELRKRLRRALGREE